MNLKQILAAGCAALALQFGSAEAQSLGSTPVTPSQLAAALNVAAYPGATVDAKITACIAALPSTGGVCDARSVPGGGTINAMTITKSGVTILAPCGTTTLTGTIKFDGVQGDIWLGCGLNFSFNGTSFLWAGNSTDPAFQVVGSREVELGNFGVFGNISTPISAAIQQQTKTAKVSTDNYYHDLTLEGGNGGIGKGIQVCVGNACGGAGTDQGNDIGKVERVVVSNYSDAAFSLEGTQAHGWLFLDDACVATGGGLGNYCIHTTTGGSFTAINLSGGTNAIADFYLGTPSMPITIIGGTFEGSNRLLSTNGASSGGFPITLMGTRWSGLNLNADNNVIVYELRGGLQLIGIEIDAPKTGTTPQFIIKSTGNNANAFATGNVITWPSGTVTATSNPFTGNTTGNAGQWRTIGNFITDGGSNVFAIPDTLGGSANPTNAGLIADPGSNSNRTLTYSGTCTAINKLGGIMAGSFVASGACAGGTYILTTNLANVLHGLSCKASDLTTPANILNQTAYTTTSVTFTGTTSNSDLIAYSCIGF